MIGGQKINLRIFSNFPMSSVNFAYQHYRIPLRTALSIKSKSHLTLICIFRGPSAPMQDDVFNWGAKSKFF